MDASRRTSKDSQQRHKKIAEKTAEAIAKEGTQSNDAEKREGEKPIPGVPNTQRTQHINLERAPPRACRMFFPTSGHQGFDLLKVSDELPAVETVRAMILYETRLRLSDSIQEIMDDYHDDEAAVR